MKIKKKYIAIDPYYSDFEISFIGDNLDKIDEQIFDFEKYLGREHPSGISTIYKTEFA